MFQCECDDQSCLEVKKRLQVCREEVLAANARDAIVSCRVAQLICTADNQCSTALGYYERYCRKMFEGRRYDKILILQTLYKDQ